MPGKSKTTVSAIAKEAGVSPATVSRVINQRYDLVTEQTVQTVHDAMIRLGCEIPAAAPPCPRERPILLCCIPDGNPFYEKLIQGILSSANSHGFHLLFHQGPLDRGSVSGFFDLVRRIGVSGAIILNHVSADLLMEINSIVPIIQCAEFNQEVDLPYVSIDDRKAARAATEYLISRGRNKIAFINGPSTYKYARERKLGYIDAIQEARLTIPGNWVVDLPEINYEMAYSAVCQMLNSEPVPNAFFAASDTFAAAVLRAARHYHYHVPQDIMAIGFDNTAISYMCTPPITTVSQPEFQEGYTACELLIKKILDPETEVHSILLETELIIRETT